MSGINLTDTLHGNEWFIEQVGRESGQPVQQCYQCGKCTAGCPIAFSMDVPPHRVMRMVQLGLRDKALGCNSIWLCAYCSTCTVRCPRNVNLAQVMDCLRIMAGRENRAGSGRSRHVALFNRNFLNSVRRYGRLHEFDTMLKYNLISRQPFKNIDTGLYMLSRGKLKFLIKKTGQVDQVRNIFARVKELEEQSP